jgi:hypothetical protein
MKKLDELLQALWKNYTAINTQADGIHKLLGERGETVINDHIAFRTFNISAVGVDVLAQHFIKLGYEEKGEYEFKVKKLFAKHFEHPDPSHPRIFISELKIEEFSQDLQGVVKQLVSQVPKDRVADDSFPISGRLWDPVSWETYLKLKEESEYAAWLAVFGFRPNHFTVLLNELKTFKSLEDYNQFIKDNGFSMNDSGGEIKGTPKELLEQSSTKAHEVEVEFSDRKETIPSVYYEFAKRYPMPDGNLFMGFIAKSADKIFESTDNKDNV